MQVETGSDDAGLYRLRAPATKGLRCNKILMVCKSSAATFSVNGRNYKFIYFYLLVELSILPLLNVKSLFSLLHGRHMAR